MANLLTFRREGKAIYYRLDDEHVEKIFQLGLEHILHKRGK
jgi:DNA-binding transcriptional ArsR family regulator